MKKSVKIIMAILLIVAMLLTFSNNIFASNVVDQLESKISTEAPDSDLLEKAGQVIGLIRNVAIIAAVIVLMVIGVKFILGSAEEKAEYKKSLIPLVVGIVVVVIATSVVSFIFDFVD